MPDLGPLDLGWVEVLGSRASFSFTTIFIIIRKVPAVWQSLNTCLQIGHYKQLPERDCRRRGQQDVAHGPNMACQLISQIKFEKQACAFTYACTVMAGLSSHDTENMAHPAKNSFSLALCHAY